MKFIYADSMDFVDPGYDFLQDRNAADRRPYWDDLYPHEILGYAPYDGILVSRGIVGDHRVSGKYSEAQAMRFRRAGARGFLRLDGPRFADLALFGDCGAFTYHKEPEPPYKPEEMVEFYDDAGFSHGCSVDHIIFDFDETLNAGLAGGSEDARRRFEITLENASEFLRSAKSLSSRFTPLGVIQGWSSGSMAEAAKRLVKMGYRYLAVGGMVPLKASQIRSCLHAIRSNIPPDIALHVLGFAKADEIETFVPFGITSFDSTSPLIRAFKDSKSNYYLRNDQGRLEYYTAIRIPQALENTKLLRLVKQGDFRQEDLLTLERSALDAIRAFDLSEEGLEETLEAVLAYGTPAILGMPIDQASRSKALEELRARYKRTLSAQPWKRCHCAICRAISVEVIIFRASNRNKRRGIHNLAVFKNLVDNLSLGDARNGQTDVFGRACPTESDAHRCDVRDDGGRTATVCSN